MGRLVFLSVVLQCGSLLVAARWTPVSAVRVARPILNTVHECHATMWRCQLCASQCLNQLACTSLMTSALKDKHTYGHDVHYLLGLCSVEFKHVYAP